MQPNLLEIKELKVHFPFLSGFFLKHSVGDIKAVDGVSLTVKKGEILGLAGESGCGKSTLAKTVMQLIKPTSGKVLLNGTDLCAIPPRKLRKLRSRFQMIFQDPYASLNPRMTIYEILQEAFLANHQYAALKPIEIKNKIEELMQKVGLDPTFILKYPHEFSGGQRQRIAIARALAPAPELLIADEPVSALDVSIQSQILNLIRSLCREMGLTLLFIGHDLSVLKYLCDRIAVMYLGKIVEVGEASAIMEKPLHPYTQALVSAIPFPDPRSERTRQRIVLSGELPSPIHPPSGCPFHPRCSYATEECRRVIPPLTSPAPDLHPTACIRVLEINQ